jgi:hypothetical protein
MQRQLPQITQRLNSTLEKLRSPGDGPASTIDATAWWNNLIQRYSNRSIQFSLDGSMCDTKLPAELFDSVADNLIENALKKSAETADLSVRVIFSAVGGGTLTVSDNGLALRRSVAQDLFSAPVHSQTGFGVGLYQLSRLAADFGYRFRSTQTTPTWCPLCSQASTVRGMGYVRRGSREALVYFAGASDHGSWPAAIMRVTRIGMGIHHTMSSNSVPDTVLRTRVTKIRSALPPFGLGF